MTTLIIAVDPGNNSGITFGLMGGQTYVEGHDFTPKKATKKRAAEPEHLRYGKLLKQLVNIVNDYKASNVQSIVIGIETANGFVAKGKSAGQILHEYRGVVKAFAGFRGYLFHPIQPADLKRFALGKGVGEKTEMIAFAKKAYGYQGTNDNEADSLILWHWINEQLLRVQTVK